MSQMYTEVSDLPNQGVDAPSQPRSIDVAQIIDDSKMGMLQRLVLYFCGTVMIFDGFDVQLITFVAPVLTKALDIDKAMLAPVFAAGLLGTMSGAFVFGPLADRFGRKNVLLSAVSLFGLCALGTITSTTINEFYVWRFVGGLGLGGATPIAVAMTSEYCSKRFRSTLVMIMYCGYSVGAAGGGVLSAYLIPAFGWQSVFIVGGLVPLVTVALMCWTMPESIGYLVLRTEKIEKISRLIRCIDASVNLDNVKKFSFHKDTAKGFPVMDLFTNGMLSKTLVLWVMFFTNIVSLYFMVSWFPTLISSLGVPVKQAVLSSTLIQVGSIAGTLSISGLVQRFAPFRLLATGYLGGASSLLLLSTLGSSTTFLPVLAFIAGYFVIGTQTAANAVGALVYPTSMRSTGIGWALGVGRIGSVVGPVIGGALVGLKWLVSDLFVVAAIPAVVAMMAALTMLRLQGKTE